MSPDVGSPLSFFLESIHRRETVASSVLALAIDGNGERSALTLILLAIHLVSFCLLLFWIWVLSCSYHVGLAMEWSGCVLFPFAVRLGSLA